jgi:flagellar protein FliS
MPLRLAEQECTMNASTAISAYTNIKNQTLSTEDVGYNVVSTALHKLETNLHILSSANKTKERVKAYEQTLLTIYFLQKSLNFSGEDDLAKNLFRLYEFCRITVLKKGIIKSYADFEVKQCHSFILEIVKSWDTVKNT